MTFHEFLLALVPVAAIAASIAIWAAVFARVKRNEVVVALEPRRPVPWLLFDLALVLVVYFLLTILGIWVLRDLWQLDLPNDQRDVSQDFAAFQFLDMAARLFTVVLAIVVIRLRTQATFADFGLSLSRWRYDMLLGIVGFLALAAPVYSLQALLFHFFPMQHPLIDVLEKEPSNQTFFVVGLSVSIVAPLSEEFLLRVLVQGWLERVVAIAMPDAFPGTVHWHTDASATTESAKLDAVDENPNAAPRPIANEIGGTLSANIRVARAIPVFASASIFALLHFGQGPAPVPLFFLALGLGYLYQRTHRLWPSAIVHFLLNTSSLTILWLQTG